MWDLIEQHHKRRSPTVHHSVWFPRGFAHTATDPGPVSHSLIWNGKPKLAYLFNSDHSTAVLTPSLVSSIHLGLRSQPPFTPSVAPPRCSALQTVRWDMGAAACLARSATAATWIVGYTQRQWKVIRRVTWQACRTGSTRRLKFGFLFFLSTSHIPALQECDRPTAEWLCEDKPSEAQTKQRAAATWVTSPLPRSPVIRPHTLREQSAWSSADLFILKRHKSSSWRRGSSGVSNTPT